MIKKIVLFALGLFFISYSAIADPFGSGSDWGEGSLKMGNFSIVGDATNGLSFDPDNDGINEIGFSDNGVCVGGAGNLSLAGDIYLGGQDIIWGWTKLSWGLNGLCLVGSLSNTGNLYTQSITGTGDFTINGSAAGGCSVLKCWVDTGDTAIFHNLGVGNDLIVENKASADGIALHPGSTVTVASSTARGKNTADYICDGTADNVEIQAAIDALGVEGGGYKFTEGVNTIAATIDSDKRISYVGQQSGSKGTELILADNADCDMFDLNPAVGAVDTHYQLTRFEHMKLDGNSANQSVATHAIDQNAGSAVDLYLYDIWFDSWEGYCIDLQQYWDHRIERCVFEGNTTYGIHLERVGAAYPSPVWVDHCFYPSVLQDGDGRGGQVLISDNIIDIGMETLFDNFDLKPTKLLFSDNSVSTSTGGLRTANTYTVLKINATAGHSSPNDITITDNQIVGCTDKYGIDLGGSGTVDFNHVVISDNLLDFDDGTSVIHNTGTGQIMGLIIAGNTIEGQSDDSMTGIYVGDSNGGIVSGNYLKNFATAVDISDASCFNTIISGNTFAGNTVNISAAGSATYEPLIYGNKENDESYFIVRGDNGSLPAAIADDVYGIYINNSAVGDDCEVDLISGTAGNSTLNFGDSADEDAGNIDYDNNTDLMTIVSGGDITLDPAGNNLTIDNADVNIGTAGTYSSTTALSINRSIANTAYVMGLTIEGTYDSTSNGAYAMWMNPTLDPNNGYTVTGIFSDGTVVADAGTTVSDAYGAWIDDFAKSGTGTVTEAYSLWLDGQTIGSTNYNIYANGTALNYFGGATTFASTLKVTGATTAETGMNYAADAGANDDYSITISGLTALNTGLPVYFYANTANTGACTLDVDGAGALAAKPLKSLHDQDPQDNYIEAGSMVHCIYDGTNFQIMSPDANP